ncbi:hypothetical protein NL354_29475, partial [Klebsiella pneumoniae]|nr:hypothetical protein [Klebsiella pneumoniae]
APYEEKVFVQNFLPYSELSSVQNASTRLVMRLERQASQLALGLYAVAPLHDVRVEIRDGEQTLWRTQVTLEPGESWQETLAEG